MFWVLLCATGVGFLLEPRDPTGDDLLGVGGKE